jgi:hypothetical protein
MLTLFGFASIGFETMTDRLSSEIGATTLSLIAPRVALCTMATDTFRSLWLTGAPKTEVRVEANSF